MGEFLYFVGLFLGAIVGLLIYIALCLRFSYFASDKGYSGTFYFWMCFLFSGIAFCWVAALPDKNILNDIKALYSSLPAAQSSHVDKTWICKTCNTENSSNYGQCKKCGNNR